MILTFWEAFALAHMIVAVGLFFPVYTKTYYGSGKFKNMKFETFILSMLICSFWLPLFVIYMIFVRRK